ncbi:MAG: ComF family protein [Akkermansiaceae bacterium]|jgi:competence protein ComFC
MRNLILDLIYPPVCELCKSGLDRGSALCETCQDSLPKIREPFCQNCGEVFDGNLPDHFSCPNCQGLALDFKFARASLQGREQAFELVHLLKYHRRFYLARNLARYMENTRLEDDRFREFDENTFVIPVPLHWRRQQWRQGNQAHELARHFCKLNDLPLCTGLKRIRATVTQTKLNRHQRLNNLKDAFTIKKSWISRLKGTNVILIDDVFTTGATSHACSRILKREGGVSNVAILSLVRG